ncbi:hypothetical protein C8J56DRAFT_1174299 [Mycena floridula]|nr:hypothetical protein C8J56DRAFT_1138995 [Mycena floridula]KAJ7572952.1 hypothetical protein C8J56DRAFT_1174299 [Mycena floridula]
MTAFQSNPTEHQYYNYGNNPSSVPHSSQPGQFQYIDASSYAGVPYPQGYPAQQYSGQSTYMTSPSSNPQSYTMSPMQGYPPSSNQQYPNQPVYPNSQNFQASGYPSVVSASHSDQQGGTIKACSHCQRTTTPLWRREPGTNRPLCNACGLYLQQRHKLRPQELIDADNEESSDGEGDGTGPQCNHCGTHKTSVWRRGPAGEQLCNACGVYLRLNGKERPLALKKNRIRPRSKHGNGPRSG